MAFPTLKGIYEKLIKLYFCSGNFAVDVSMIDMKPELGLM